MLCAVTFYQSSILPASFVSGYVKSIFKHSKRGLKLNYRQTPVTNTMILHSEYNTADMNGVIHIHGFPQRILFLCPFANKEMLQNKLYSRVLHSKQSGPFDADTMLNDSI